MLHYASRIQHFLIPMCKSYMLTNVIGFLVPLQHEVSCGECGSSILSHLYKMKCLTPFKALLSWSAHHNVRTIIFQRVQSHISPVFLLKQLSSQLSCISSAKQEPTIELTTQPFSQLEHMSQFKQRSSTSPWQN